jgi:hypothetical protein
VNRNAFRRKKRISQTVTGLEYFRRSEREFADIV